MKQINKILYTTDLSESSIDVFEQTVVLAAQTGASISILHVIEDTDTGTQKRLVHLVDRERYEQIRKEGQDKVRTTLVGKQKGVPAIQRALQELCDKTNDKVCQFDEPVVIDGIEVQFGNAADVINQMVELTGCDMIAMGFHKKGSILKSLTGSSGTRIIKQSKCPIFLVPLEG